MILNKDNTDLKRQKAGVIQIGLTSDFYLKGSNLKKQHRTTKEQLEEAINLTEALNLEVSFADIVNLREINSRTVIGKGKIEELRFLIEQHGVDMVFINYQLSPSHQNNLEKDLGVKVVDRTGLILEIFYYRARTKTGKLQVELARALYEQTRLVRTWTHLERQRGGLGKTGGPGERQIELDRRILRDKIAKLKKQLKEVERTRIQHAKKRYSNGVKVVSLVGYTNSGKSTLFNALTNAGTLSKDMLFATLDPLMRKVVLPSGEIIILSDTVGFISELPHELIESFNSTLKEVLESDLLIHVHDFSSEYYSQEKQDVNDVLKSIGAENIRKIDVLNKVDLIPEDGLVGADGVAVSALNKQGMENLLEVIEKSLNMSYIDYELKVNFKDSNAMNFLYKNGKDLEIKLENDDFYKVHLKLKKEDYYSYLKLSEK